MEKVLVTYGTKYGATAEIAEKIGQVLQEAGLPNDVLAADGVGDLAPYKAVILGSAVYIGQWRKEAVKFVQANEAALAQRPVWIFSSGPTGEGDPVELVQGWTLPDKLKPAVDNIKPRDIAVFHGVNNPDKMNWLERFMIGRIGAPMGDFRDWEAITAWANSIADALKGAGPA